MLNKVLYRQNRRKFIYSMVLFLFFEPNSVDQMMIIGHDIWKKVDTIYKVSEIGISLIAIAWITLLFIRRACRVSKISTLVTIQSCIIILACIYNNSISIKLCGRILVYIGLISACTLMSRDLSCFLWSGRWVFGVYSISNIIATIIFPRGLAGTGSLYSAVFLLGGKNGSFVFYYGFLSCTILHDIYIKGTISKKLYFIIFIMLSTAIVYQSANTFICILLIGLICFLHTNHNRLFRTQNIIIICVAEAMVLLLIYSGAHLQILSRILLLAGRDISFSNRDILWGQALSAIRNNPIFGAGDSLEFLVTWSIVPLRSIWNPHSQFLDQISKYGLLQFAFQVGAIFYLLYRIQYHTYKKYSALLGDLLIIYILHMGFDVYDYTFFIYSVMLINVISRQLSVKKLRCLYIRMIASRC